MQKRDESGQSSWVWNKIFSVSSLFCVLSNDYLFAALSSSYLEEQINTAWKDYRTVKRDTISHANLPLVITRMGFCKNEKPTFRSEERLFIGKTLIPQHAKWPVFADLPTLHCAELLFTIGTIHSAKCRTIIDLRKRLFDVKMNDLFSVKQVTRRGAERLLRSYTSHYPLKIVIKKDRI